MHRGGRRGHGSAAQQQRAAAARPRHLRWFAAGMWGAGCAWAAGKGAGNKPCTAGLTRFSTSRTRSHLQGRQRAPAGRPSCRPGEWQMWAGAGRQTGGRKGRFCQMRLRATSFVQRRSGWTQPAETLVQASQGGSSSQAGEGVVCGVDAADQPPSADANQRQRHGRKQQLEQEGWLRPAAVPPALWW